MYQMNSTGFASHIPRLTICIILLCNIVNWELGIDLTCERIKILIACNEAQDHDDHT